MQAMIKIPSFFVLFIMMVSCTMTQRGIPEKYNLDEELEAVDRISPADGPAWQYVDKQSLVLRVNWNNYYLIVLRRPIYGLNSVVLGMTSKVPVFTGSIADRDKALDELKQRAINIIDRSSRLRVKDSGVEEYYAIEKIYKFKGQEQKEEIKSRLCNF